MWLYAWESSTSASKSLLALACGREGWLCVDGLFYLHWTGTFYSGAAYMGKLLPLTNFCFIVCGIWMLQKAQVPQTVTSVPAYSWFFLSWKLFCFLLICTSCFTVSPKWLKNVIEKCHKIGNFFFLAVVFSLTKQLFVQLVAQLYTRVINVALFIVTIFS